MILDYTKSILFIMIFIIAIYLAGSGFVNKNKSFSLKFIIGYVVYNAILTIGGIVIQYFNLNWYLFLFFEILVVVLLIIYAVYKNRDIFYVFKNDLHRFVKNQWLILIICIILLGMSIMDIPIHWLNNHLDDGYYLNRIANLPYQDNTFLIDPASGLLSKQFFTRVINVFELEASGYVYLLQVSPVVFVRFSLSFINYFLFLQCAFLFASKMKSSLSIKIDEKFIQFFLTPVLFFGFYYEWLIASNFLVLQDGWQFNAAMWYGSSVVRVSGIFLCLIPFVEHPKIKYKDFIYFILLCFCLVGKATQAVPVLFITGTSYLLYNLIVSKNKKNIIFAGFIVISLLLVSLLNGINLNLYQHIISLMAQNKFSFILWGSFVVFIISFSLKSSLIRKWNVMLILFFSFMFIPKFNSVFLLLSSYDFVAARTLTLFIYTFITTSFVYFFLLLFKFFNLKKVLCCSLVIFVGLNFSWLFLYHYALGIRTSLGIIKSNPEIYPQKIIELSENLEKISIKKGMELDVLSNEFISVNQNSFSLSVMLRLYAPSINSISSLPRYPNEVDEEYKTFSVEDQNIFYEFVDNPSKNLVQFSEMLRNYSIECIITTKDCNQHLNTLGYQLAFTQPVDTYDTYDLYIYIKE